MRSFAIDSSLGFGLAMLGFLILKAKILTKCSEITPLKKLFASAFYMSLKKIECNNSLPSVVIEVQ